MFLYFITSPLIDNLFIVLLLINTGGQDNLSIKIAYFRLSVSSALKYISDLPKS